LSGRILRSPVGRIAQGGTAVPKAMFDAACEMVDNKEEPWGKRLYALSAMGDALEAAAACSLVRGMSFNHIQIGSIKAWYDPNIKVRTGDTITFEIIDNGDALDIGITVTNAISREELLNEKKGPKAPGYSLD